MPSTFYAESQGNQIFINMLPQIINVIEQPGMLVIDEFGNSLHNRLAEKIVRFFMEKSKQSQLYITLDAHWAVKQEIKNELLGQNRVAIEVFPEEKSKIDVQDIYHLWVMPKGFKLPFGIYLNVIM